MQRVVIKQPGKPPTIEMIEAGLERVQKLVEGHIDIAMKGRGFFADGGDLVAYVNDEGHVREPPMPPNILRPSDGWPLLGPIVVVKNNAHGADVSMTEEEAARALQTISAMRAA